MQKKSLVLFLLTLLVSCNEVKKETQIIYQDKDQLNSVESNQKAIEELDRLLNSSTPNLALAEILARSLSKEQKKFAQNILSELTQKEIEQILTELKKDNQTVRRNYIFHGDKVQEDFKFVNGILLESETENKANLSFDQKVKIAVTGQLKNKYLSEIINTYSERSQQLAEEIANSAMVEISKDNYLSREIEGLTSEQDEEKSLVKITEKLDQFFKNSTLSDKQQYTVIATGLVAGVIYQKVKDNRTFKVAIKLVSKTIEDLKTIKQKFDELSALAGSLNKHYLDSQKNMEDFISGVKETQKEMRELFNKAQNDLKKENVSKVEAREIMNELYQQVILGKKFKEENRSVLSTPIRISENVTKTVSAAEKMSTNLSSILETTKSISAALNIKLDPKIDKLISKAQQVTSFIQSAQTIMGGLATGGPVVAFAALGSSSALKMLAPGAEGATAAKLDEISRKLDRVLENQRKIIQLQMDTMKMINDLALMIDEYHQKQMMALAELRNQNLVTHEMLKAGINSGIRQCEKMINFKISSVWKNYSYQKNNTYGIREISLIKSKVYENLNSLNDIHNMLNLTESSYSICQTALVDVFGGGPSHENPVISIFSNEKDEKLFVFQRDVYLPLVESLKYYAKSDNYAAMALHLPSKNFQTQKIKDQYVISASLASHDLDLYDLDSLISTKSLERYLAQLLILYPFMDVSKSDWSKDYKSIISSYFENSFEGMNQNLKSHFYLTNALRLVQSSIAQEALLAGEPIMRSLLLTSGSLLNNEKCSAVKNVNAPYLETFYFCMLRKNNLLMKNFLMVLLNNKAQNDLNFASNYKIAYEQGNLNLLASLIGQDIKSDRLQKRIEFEKAQLFISLPLDTENVEVRLPTPEEMSEGKILYSENMDRLLNMQSAVLDALETVAPLRRNYGEMNLLKLMISDF